jgi:hypothetical protein
MDHGILPAVDRGRNSDSAHQSLSAGEASWVPCEASWNDLPPVRHPCRYYALRDPPPNHKSGDAAAAAYITFGLTDGVDLRANYMQIMTAVAIKVGSDPFSPTASHARWRV